MTRDSKDYRVVPFPAARKVIVDAGRHGIRRHIINGLLELDVTRPRQAMRAYKAQTVESLSFTAFIVTCLAHAIQADPSVQAYRNWRNRLIIFHDVDVVAMIETEVGGVALPHVIRGANHKTFRQVHDEIRAVQSNPVRSEQQGGLIDLAGHLPAFVRDFFYWVVLKNPHWFKSFGGTVMVTSVGMFGTGGGWGFGFLPYHTLGLTVGGIAQKPGIVDGRIEAREFLDLTISLDHDIVDGAPAARFAQQFKELVESGYGLISD
jgi:pyruvate/2-oxoglutarate dehydrogenase complex dihydrolipoamide acyltransferase (E2) component